MKKRIATILLFSILLLTACNPQPQSTVTRTKAYPVVTENYDLVEIALENDLNDTAKVLVHYETAVQLGKQTEFMEVMENFTTRIMRGEKK